MKQADDALCAVSCGSHDCVAAMTGDEPVVFNQQPRTAAQQFTPTRLPMRPPGAAPARRRAGRIFFLGGRKKSGPVREPEKANVQLIVRNSDLTGIFFSVERYQTRETEKYSTNYKTDLGRKMEVEARKETVLVPVTPNGSAPRSE